ncbi:MAG: hypothetical protein O3B42_07850 [Actinomycetota bacterium]|nr:hypothetical protein [Actinomycetota bacterium]
MASNRSAAGLTRGFNLQRLSNRIAVFGWLSSFVLFLGIAVVWDWMSYPQTVTSSAVVFMGWAIGRELDPDRPHVATATMALALGLVFVSIPAGIVVYSSLMALRMVSGTTGRALAEIDLVLVAAVGFGSGGTIWAWPIGLVAFAWLKTAPEVGRLRWFAIGALGGGFAVGWYLQDGSLGRIDITLETVVIMVGAAVVTAIGVLSASVTGRNDARSGLLDLRRLRLSRIAAGLFVAAAALAGGTDAFWQIGAVSAGIIASAAASAGRALRRPSDQ